VAALSTSSRTDPASLTAARALLSGGARVESRRSKVGRELNSAYIRPVRPGKHILHGDLRPNGDKPGQIFADVPSAAALALAVNDIFMAACCALECSCWSKQSVKDRHRPDANILIPFARSVSFCTGSV
jgi:hypothetical protein